MLDINHLNSFIKIWALALRPQIYVAEVAVTSTNESVWDIIHLCLGTNYNCRCTTGVNCATPIINKCACNPCANFDDKCTDSVDPRQPRVCVGTPDTTGNPFTIMFMQNRPDNTAKRELVRHGNFFFCKKRTGVLTKLQPVLT